jgi:hypothetical protein
VNFLNTFEWYLSQEELTLILAQYSYRLQQANQIPFQILVERGDGDLLSLIHAPTRTLLRQMNITLALHSHKKSI